VIESSLSDMSLLIIPEKTVDDVLSIKLGMMNTYNPNKYCDIDDKDDQNMEVGFNTIQRGTPQVYYIHCHLLSWLGHVITCQKNSMTI
jgi:hypothetical protein